MSEINPGDVVWLKSDASRRMTCEMTDGGRVYCCWFDGEGMVRRGSLKSLTLAGVLLKKENRTGDVVLPGDVVELKSSGGLQMTCESRPQVDRNEKDPNCHFPDLVPGDDVYCCWFDGRGNLHSGESFKVQVLRKVVDASARVS